MQERAASEIPLLLVEAVVKALAAWIDIEGKQTNVA